MFTGLIQALGTVEPLGDDRFGIACTAGDPDSILTDLAVGDSVAVDGVCLTVVEILPGGFVAAASPETLGRTTLGENLRGSVNLEPSLRAGSKLGGHFVTGHVDAIGCLDSVESAGHSWEMRFVAPGEDSFWYQQIAPYLVPKGSIAVNGISLTIANCDRRGRWFQVAVIPHTYESTNLRHLQPGSPVNLEADILGKYVAKFLGNHPGSTGDITPEFLAEHGFG
jgi:riboflavin synthase